MYDMYRIKREGSVQDFPLSLLEPDGSVTHATGGTECCQSSRSCSDEYAEYYLPNTILLHHFTFFTFLPFYLFTFLPSYFFTFLPFLPLLRNRVLLSPGIHRHEGTYTLDVGGLAHLLDLD